MDQMGIKSEYQENDLAQKLEDIKSDTRICRNDLKMKVLDYKSGKDPSLILNVHNAML